MGVTCWSSVSFDLFANPAEALPLPWPMLPLPPSSSTPLLFLRHINRSPVFDVVRLRLQRRALMTTF